MSDIQTGDVLLGASGNLAGYVSICGDIVSVEWRYSGSLDNEHWEHYSHPEFEQLLDSYIDDGLWVLFKTNRVSMEDERDYLDSVS